MIAKPYDSLRFWLLELLAKNPIYAVLVRDYFPHFEKHETQEDITGEVEGIGYEKGGRQLSGVKIHRDPQSRCPTLFADELVWENSTLTASGCIFYARLGEFPEQNPLVGFMDFGRDESSVSGAFKLRNPRGIVILY